MSSDNQASGSASVSDASGPNLASSSSAQLPDPSLPAPNLGEDEVGFTAADLIAQQSKLEAQANEAIPFQFDTCTHERGYIRQPVYSCKTCGGGGVCAGCSVSCHAEHELVELFNKRKFRCDCGTPNLYRQREPNQAGCSTRLAEQLSYPEDAKPCTLRKPGFDPQNDTNSYNHNFDGSFCYCERGKTYDPEKEDETMFQCIVCEEWLHESCTSLRPAPLPKPVSGDDETGKASAASTTATRSADPAMPPSATEPEAPLIDHDLFDLMICDACVRKPGNELLRRYAGARGWMIVATSQDAGEAGQYDGVASIQVPTEEELQNAGGPYQGRSWRIFGLAVEPEQALTQEEVSAAANGALLKSVAEIARSSGGLPSTRPEKEEQGNAHGAAAEISLQGAGLAEKKDGKRRAEDDPKDDQTAGEGSKRVKLEAADAGCTLPEGLSMIAKLGASVVDEWVPALSSEASETKPSQRCDVFLSDDFRDRICRCADCLPQWSALPHVLEAEETYAPPSDPQASVRDDDAASVTSSTYDLGMAALRAMPREKMINSLHAYSKFRDALWEHLKPFAGTGKMVREEDVRAFFQNTLNSNK